MGKIVKYCSSCDEGFAEKFGFCPNCGASLQLFEMKPVTAEVVVEEPIAATPTPQPPAAIEPLAPVFIAENPEPVIEAAPEPVVETTAEVEEPVVEKPSVVTQVPVFASATVLDADRIPVSLEEEHSRYLRDGGFYVTVIEEKNVGTRNSLLAGTLAFMIVSLLTGLVINIFSKDLDIGAINDDIFSAVLVDLEPMTVEEEQQKKKDDDAGGGGGGGKDEKDPASQGDLADQSKTPTRPPDVNTMKSDTPMLQTPTTEGTMKFPKIYGKWGDPNGLPGLSNGPGTGGGIGSGRGTGQGSGNGTGAGSGNGSGFGSGNGNGNGSGNGDGDGPPPPAAAPKVTQALRIISKPKAMYTDAARQNAAQGTVTLRITFLASGQIGGITTVKGMGYGLTESAVAAARRIVFEPQKVNGVAVGTTKTFEYNFTLY